VNPWCTIKFLPPLLDYFFELIQNRATINLPTNNANQIQASYFGFLGLTYLIYRISEYYVNESGNSGNRCSILVAYITHRLENLHQPVILQNSTATPNAMGHEAGAAAQAAAQASNAAKDGGEKVTYVPLYSIFTKLWLVGLNPAATSDNAALFTLPSTTSSASKASMPLVSSSGGGSDATSGGATMLTSPSAASAAGSPGGSSQAQAHQTLHERLLISYAWFYFEVIYKSFVLERDRQKAEYGEFRDDEPLKSFLVHFDKLIRVIVTILYKHRTVGLTSVKHLIHNLALFFNDLFSVLEKDRVLGFISTFLHAFRLGMNYADPVLVEIKFTFYYILLDFEWFMDVCEIEPVPAQAPPTSASTGSPSSPAAPAFHDDDAEPSSTTGGVKSDPNELMSRIRARYPLIALFVEDYVANLARSKVS
jgi:hypothetical protein